MDEYEYERAKPMLWAMFANGGLSRGNTTKDSAHLADEMIVEFEKRFPVKKREEEE